jgi:hypothetical protein
VIPSKSLEECVCAHKPVCAHLCVCARVNVCACMCVISSRWPLSSLLLISSMAPYSVHSPCPNQADVGRPRWQELGAPVLKSILIRWHQVWCGNKNRASQRFSGTQGKCLSLWLRFQSRPHCATLCAVQRREGPGRSHSWFSRSLRGLLFSEKLPSISGRLESHEPQVLSLVSLANFSS